MEGTSRGTLKDLTREYKRPPIGTCYNCRNQGHHYAECEEPRAKFCRMCGLLGALTKTCPACPKKHGELSLREEADAISLNTPKTTTICSPREYGFDSMDDDDYESDPIDELLIHIEGDARPFVEVKILDKKLIGLLDSEAQRTVLGKGSEKLIDELKLKVFQTSTSAKTASGAPIEILGYVNLPITFNGETHIIPALIAPVVRHKLILGYEDFWRVYKLEPSVQIQRVCYDEDYSESEIEVHEMEEDVLTQEQMESLEEVKGMFMVAVEGEILNITPMISHKIELKEEFKNSPSVRINPYPTSPELQAKINRELDKMLAQRVIERSKSDWSLSTVPVLKPTGEVRLCLDARRLNDRTKRDAYPLPHQNRILSRLGPSKYLTTIDLSKAFLQIPLDPNSRRYTAFSVLGKGLFQFTRLPFGLVNSPRQHSLV